MSRDPRLGGGGMRDGDPYDDAAIESLVRDVAGGWTMPPVRLDQPAWRDRVRSPLAQRLDGAGGWLRRVGSAASAALALTVAGALVAVLITGPHQEPGKSPEPSSRSVPTDAPGTPLPKLLVGGDLPSPSRLVVFTERGSYALVDLEDGSRSAPLSGTTSGSDLRVRTDGTMLCLCLSEMDVVQGNPTRIEVSLVRYDASGEIASSQSVGTFQGAPDPRDAATFIAERPPHVLTSIAYSEGGRFGLVGWSARADAVWHSGIVVVNLLDGSIVSRLELPDSTSGEGKARRVVDAPRVIGTTGGTGQLVARSWYQWSPPEAAEPSFTFENDVFRADLDGGIWTEAQRITNAADCGDRVVHGGAIAGGGTWLSCSSGGNEKVTVRRLDANGAMLGDVHVPGGAGIDGDTTAVSADGTAFFAWNPTTATMTRVDLATGEETTTDGQTSQAPGGPLAAFGSWLAPSVAAKSYLEGAVVVSRDGSRVYAIGVKEGGADHELSGSRGVFAFDAVTMASIGHWQPTADFVSLAVSGDGRYVYASGLPGVDAQGVHRLTQQASITVFDAETGALQWMAGELGGDMLTFPQPVLD